MRRGVICRSGPAMAWFLSKSAKADNLFALKADFSEEDASLLVVQGVPTFNDFVRRWPPTVRARGAGHVTASRQRRKASNFDAALDERIHPHLNPVRTTKEPASSKRLKKGTPGCSPPDSPKAKRKYTTNDEFKVLVGE